MKKIVLWSVAGILILGICAGAIWWMNRPQVIQLDKNTKLTLLGVEYGKHHKFPKISATTTVRRNFGGQQNSFDTTNDTLVVWILQETKGNQRYGWQTLVSDVAETACVANWARNWNQAGANKQIAAIQMDALPRWDNKFHMRFTSWGPQGQHASKEYFVISNPTRQTSFPKWMAEPVPDAQSDGDLDVTLAKFNYNVPFNRGNGVPALDAATKAVFVQFHTEQKGTVVTNWQPIRIETSDSTGNHIFNNSWSNSRDTNGDAMMTYQWGLWPAQMPWKLRVEMSRTSGFNSDELWTVENLPVKPGSQQDLWNYGGRNNRNTNSAFAETTLNGVHLKIFPVVQTTDQNFGNGQKSGGVRIVTDSDLPEGFRMSVNATDEQGRSLQSWDPNGGGQNYVVQFPDLRNAKLLNLAIAIHQSRFVEFTATPTKQ